MLNQYNHYQEAQDLITMLRNIHLHVQADTLQSAMDDGSTGNEIFMALRWNTEKLLNEKKCTDIVFVKAKKLWEQTVKGKPNLHLLGLTIKGRLQPCILKAERISGKR